MKPFVRYTSFLLALLFLAGAAFAWVDLFRQGNFLSDPLLKPASGLLLTGVMFLAVGLRGWRPRRRRDATAKTVHLHNS